MFMFQASELLQLNSAQYPDRISHKTPQNLSVEALEVHYRIHASILKYLEQHEGKPLKKSLGKLFEQHLKSCAQGPFMKYQSNLISSSNSGKTLLVKPFKNAESTTVPRVVQNRSSSIEEIEIIDKAQSNKPSEASRSESRKRSPEELSIDNSKKMKVSGVSHLQLMQDVVALIDDLIDKVCEIASDNKANEEDIMIISSDENEELKSEKRREYKGNSEIMILERIGFTEVVKNNQNMVDVIGKEAIESDQIGKQTSTEEENATKLDAKSLQNADGKVGKKNFFKLFYLLCILLIFSRIKKEKKRQTLKRKGNP